MTSALLAALAALAAGLVVWGLTLLVREGISTRRLVHDVSGLPAAGMGSIRIALDRRLARTRMGVGLRVAADELGLTRLRPIDVVLGCTAAMVVVWIVVTNVLSTVLAPIFALAIPPLLVGLVRRERSRRQQKFVAQMPQLARVLSNATGAGLSLRTAVETAAEEMAEPACTEMGKVAQSMSFGRSLDEALKELQTRLPSREVAVLANTLIVSARSGGSLITSLRRIADTLQERRQTRREVQTALSEARSTALLIPVIGLGSLFMVRSMDPTAIDRMLGNATGQVIFGVAGVMYALGGFLFLRVTRSKL